MTWVTSSDRLRGTVVADTRHEFAFTAVLTGALNGEPLDLVGKGTIDEENGLTDGRYEVRQLPADLDPRSLGAYLMTGYPNSCATSGAKVGNPFSGSGYVYRRDYMFDTGERACLRMRCELSDHGLESYFHLEGETPSLKDVTGLADIHELWDPKSNHIKGRFDAVWLRGNSAAARATATSCYEAVDVTRLRGERKYRRLELDSRIEGESELVIVQRSELVAA